MREIPFNQKVHIGLVKQSQYIINSIINTSMLIFYTDYIGLDNAAIFGFAVFLYGFWNAVNDPIFGYYSDIRVSKGKLRVPLIKLGMPVMLIGFFFIVLVPPGLADWDIFFILLIGLIIFDFGKALSMVNYNAYNITIADNANDRAKLNMIISYVGIIPGALVGLVPLFFLTGDFVYIEILIFFIILVLIVSLISYYSLTKIEEPSEMYIFVSKAKENSSVLDRDNSPFTLKEGFQQTLTSRSFLVLILFRFVAYFYHGLISVYLVYMLRWVVPVGSTVAVIIGAIGGLLVNVMYPIIIKLRKKHGTIKVIQLCLFIGMPGYIVMFFAPDPLTFTIGHIISLISTSGLFFEGVLLGDVADEDMLKTGTHKQGMFVSIFGFFNTLSYSLVVFLFTLGLEFFQYNGELEVQADFTIGGIRFLTCIMPIIAVILCALILKFYPLKGEKYKQLRAKIEEHELENQN